MFTIFFDTETGGVQPQHPTIQLGAVAIDSHYREVASFSQNIAFNEADADPEALAMNHYTREAWADAVAPGVAAARFAAWLRPYCWIERVSKAGNPYRVARLAGYNALTFDAPRLERMFGTQFCPWDRRVRDVMQWALWYFDYQESHGFTRRPENMKLSTVAACFDVPVDGAHGALADARICALVAHELNCEAQVGF